MKLINVAVACVNQTPLDWSGNRARIERAIVAAREQQASLVLLPELALTGYGCEDTFFMPALQERAFAELEALAPASRGLVVAVGLPVYLDKALYNCAALLVDGAIAGFVGKQFLAGDGIHYEPRWFKPWPAGVREVIERGAARYPIGDLLFDVDNVRIGFEVCEDAWVANRPGAELALRGVDVLLNPSASHFAFGKFAVRQRFVIEGSRAFGVAYLYANLLGNEAGRVVYDGGALIASSGELLARGRRLTFSDVELATAVVDIEACRREQARRGSHRPRYGDVHGLVECAFRWPERRPQVPTAIAPSWEDAADVKGEEFARAVSLGLWDYLRKSKASGYVVSLSGGADSSACAVLVAMAARRAVGELGPDGVAIALAHAPWIRGWATGGDPAALTGHLLATAYQATENSGGVTRTAASELARALAATHYEFDVDALVRGYVGLLEKALQRPLAWSSDDIALQNVQARTRAPTIWMLANLRGAVLLTTSNRSEAAVGYATMDGDTAGGLAPLGGIDKTYLRQWLRWMEAIGPSGLGPIPALSFVNAQQPTAELRPRAQAQTDEGDLMPYDLLEAVEDSAIRDKRSPLEVYLELAPRYCEHAPVQLALWIERFFTLWCRNQWKRERLAPSFHLDDRNVDPRSWCRFPILSGAFADELAELRKHVASESAASEISQSSRP